MAVDKESISLPRVNMYVYADPGRGRGGGHGPPRPLDPSFVTWVPGADLG